MAHLWTEGGASWALLPLDDDLLAFDGGGRLVPNALREEPLAAAIVRARGDGLDQWVLAAAPDSHPRPRINGTPLGATLRLLTDRDEIAIGATTLFFSSETLPRVAPCAAAEPVMCPRCKTAIAPGELSIQCPGCRTLFHQHEEKPCYTYGPTCPLCSRHTALDQSYSWTPASL